MNKKQAVIVVAVLLALVLPGRGEVTYGGYLSVEYLKGQPASAYPRGTVENLLAGFLVAGRIELHPRRDVRRQGRAFPRALRDLEPGQPAPRDGPHPHASQLGIPLSSELA
jgi:hypothetical protein